MEDVEEAHEGSGPGACAEELGGQGACGGHGAAGGEEVGEVHGEFGFADGRGDFFGADNEFAVVAELHGDGGAVWEGGLCEGAAGFDGESAEDIEPTWCAADADAAGSLQEGCERALQATLEIVYDIHGRRHARRVYAFVRRLQTGGYGIGRRMCGESLDC